jgi:hypothetical protein
MNRLFFRNFCLALLLALAAAQAPRAAQNENTPASPSAEESQAGAVSQPDSPVSPADDSENSAQIAPAPDPRARPLLDEILRRPEFSSVHKKDPLEKVKRWLSLLLIRLLDKFFGLFAGYPMAGSFLFWLLVFGAAVWLAFILFRFWNRRARLEELQPLDQVLSLRTWQEWIGLARQAASRGDFREAIHSVYWASITHLAARGFLPAGRAFTPREYLRLLSADSAAILPPPSLPAQRQSLALLTARLETVWYGRGQANAEDFRATLQQAEELGCRLE